jgi:predicted DNA-binding transcriptional regulator AlpA
MTQTTPTFEQVPAYLLGISNRIGNLEQLLEQQGYLKQAEPDRWFNVKEFCDYHPNKISIPTAYGYVHRNEVPFHKTGKCLRFLKSEIDIWLKEGRRKTVTELQAEANNYLRKK